MKKNNIKIINSDTIILNIPNAFNVEVVEWLQSDEPINVPCKTNEWSEILCQ